MSGRTFIEPQQSIRHFGVRVKLNPVRSILEGRRVVLVDDSLVRGTTSRKIVKMVKAAGAKEVHMRISCPPTISPCFYGVDTPRRSELIAATHTLEEIQKYIGADSVGYLSLEGHALRCRHAALVLLHVLLHRSVSGGVPAQRSGVSAAGAQARHRCGQDVAFLSLAVTVALAVPVMLSGQAAVRRAAAGPGARAADDVAEAIQAAIDSLGNLDFPVRMNASRTLQAGAGRGCRARADSSGGEPQGSVRQVPRARAADRVQRRAHRRARPRDRRPTRTIGCGRSPTCTTSIIRRRP